MKQVILWVLISMLLPLAASESSTSPDIQQLEAQLKISEGEARIDILNRLAAQLFYKEPGQSIQYSAEAVTLSDQFNDRPGKAEALFFLARAHWNLDDIKNAFKYIFESLKLFKALGDKANTWRVTRIIGYYYLKIGNFPEAQKYNIQALELSVETGDKDRVAESHYQLGRIYLDVNRYKKALAHFQNALKITEKSGSRLEILCLNNIGVAYKSLGQYSRALEYYQQALKLSRQDKDMADNITGALINIGIVYGQLGQHDRALSYLFEARKKNEEIGNKTSYIQILFFMGNQYFNKKNYEMSRYYYLKALEIVEKTEIKRLKEEIYKSLSDLYVEMGDNKEALHFYRMYSTIKDSRVNETKNKQYLELQERYNAERREREIEILKRDNKIQQITRNFSLAGFLVILILLFFLLKKYRYLFSFWKREKYINQYRIIEPIGEGGMGNVFKAHHVRDKTSMVAIKVLKDVLFRIDTNRKRFKNEGIIIDQLNHPHIVKVYERGESDGKMYIVMEYIQGETLERRMAGAEKIDLKTCIHMMIQITDALAKIHSKNIVHRDLKPANILITEKEGDANFIKLLDFGLSRMKFQTRFTQPGVIVGTINYVSPEQIIDLQYSSASDIYSLGIIFYEMAAGKAAFPGDSMPAVVDRILNRKLEPLSLLRPEIPEVLGRLINQMLLKEPAQRPTAEFIFHKLQEIDFRYKQV
jgi:tetratricopeptide (TPR) repeat protein